MATVSTHLLDSVNGTHAAGVRSQLFRVEGDAGRQLLFDVETDAEGRIAESVELAGDAGAEFELVFHVRDYFAAHGQEVLSYEHPFGDRSYHARLGLQPLSAAAMDAMARSVLLREITVRSGTRVRLFRMSS